MQTVAFYARLGQATEGTAIRTPDRRCFFLTADTQVWTELTNTDIPRLSLLGHLPTAQAQALMDGNLVAKASKTLQPTRKAA